MALTLVRRALSYAHRRAVALLVPDPWRGGEAPSEWTETQVLFCEWNAGRLGIPIEESRQRLAASWKAIRGGHGGRQYRQFSDLSYDVFQAFVDDSRKEVVDAYQFHGALHFLRMLSYPEPAISDEDLILLDLRSRSDATIIDFGCGLAQWARAMAAKLHGLGLRVHLVLADIPTLRKPFLLWLGERTGIPTTFVDCVGDELPGFPPCDICVATQVFEHLHEPMTALRALDASLRPGGWLVTNVHDHRSEFMHVSPRLAALRAQLELTGYDEIVPRTRFRKGTPAR